jgi:hypothetical protein
MLTACYFFFRFDAASLAILDRLSRIEALLDVPANNQPPSHPSPHASSTSGGAVMPSNATTIRTHSPGLRGSDHPAEASEIFPISISTAAASRVENVLQWPVFQGKISTEDILAPVFANKGDDSDDEDSEDGEAQGWGNDYRPDRHSMEHQNGQHEHQDGDDYSPSTKKGPMYIDEKVLLQTRGEIAILVKRFFRNVHTKNPILDSSELEKYANHVERVGEFGWTGKACLLVSTAYCFRLMVGPNKFTASGLCPGISISVL